MGVTVIMLGILLHFLPGRRRWGLGLFLVTAMLLAAPYLTEWSRAAAATPNEPASEEVDTVTSAENTAENDDRNSRNFINPLDQLQKLEALKTLELTNQGFDWRRDWWRYLILIFGSLIILYFGLHITRLLCRLAVFALCVGVGILGAFLLAPRLAPLLAEHLPSQAANWFSAHHVGYAIGFLISFGLSNLILHWLPGPVRQMTPRK